MDLWFINGGYQNVPCVAGGSVSLKQNLAEQLTTAECCMREVIWYLVCSILGIH